MKISVITPSFNQAKFLPYNLASVKAQQGVDVEHIVVDPGSFDGSTEIARKEPGVMLIAEPDRGQSDGICKGFAQATGEILVWLNSDDFYPNEHVLSSVAKCFQENQQVDIVYGDVNFVNEEGNFLRKGFVNKNANQLLESFEYQVGIVQPGVFWRRRVFEEIGGPSEEFEYCMDYELWVRMASKGYKWKYISKILAYHRWWDGMKTSSGRDLSLREHFRVCERYFGYVHWKWLDRYAEFLCTNKDGVVNHATSIPHEEKMFAIRQAIDEVITQEMLSKISQATEKEQVETKQYVYKHYPEKKRIYFKWPEIEIASEYSDDSKAQERVAWNIFNATSSCGRHLSAYHVPDNFDRYFDHAWHNNQLDRARRSLEVLSKQKNGDICVIVGNGPSLRKSDLSLLENVDTIISNFAVINPELSRYGKFLTVVNDLVAKQGAIDFNSSRLIKIVPFWLANYFNENDHTFFVNATVRPNFGEDFVYNASWRSTVSFFNMQLAYAIGYKKVILIGFDHSYVQPKGVVEGVVISQTENDDNHFDPRYFKGKDWQAADTGNMEKMYVVAKDAYDKDGREIVNCTVGGKLDVFRRGDLVAELGLNISAMSNTKQDIKRKLFPKLLVVDSTPVGHRSATGQLKKKFLKDWPKESFLQIWENASEKSTLHLIEMDQLIANSQSKPLSLSILINKCKEFRPDVIYFRPVDSTTLFVVTEQIVSELDKPLVVHMMDDWPERLRITDIEKYIKLDTIFRRLVGRASQLLSICDAMSSAYKIRYGTDDWVSLANGVDLATFKCKNWGQRKPISQTEPFLIRYMGGLAEDMSFTSVADVAQAVSVLHDEYHIRFEIYTMAWYKKRAEEEFGGLSGVFVSELVDDDEYKHCLSEADALLIAYNFDPLSVHYIGLSFANKIPECFASGAVVLAYGPPEVATISFLKKCKCAKVVDRRDKNNLRSAIETLMVHPNYCQQLGEQGRIFVGKHLTEKEVQQKFYDSIVKALPKTKSTIGFTKPKANLGIVKPLMLLTETGYKCNILHGKNYSYKSDQKWEFIDSNDNQKLWQAIFNMHTGDTAGKEYVASIRLNSDRDMTIHVSLGRFGNDEFEGLGKAVKLISNKSQLVQLRKIFNASHSALKIQIDVKKIKDGDKAILQIDSIMVAETISSIKQRIPQNKLTLHTANNLFRQKDYFTSLGIYLMLAGQNPLNLYTDNALMAAQKLGIQWDMGMNEMIQRTFPRSRQAKSYLL